MLNEDEENAVNEKHQDSVQEETTVVSATMKVRVENYHQSRLLPVNRKKMVKNFRERKIPEAGVRMRNCLESGADSVKSLFPSTTRLRAA